MEGREEDVSHRGGVVIGGAAEIDCRAAYSADW